MNTFDQNALRAESPSTRSGAMLMAHMIAHFPSRDASLGVARALAEGGAAYLEVQFPFSDPSADGSLIQNAGTAALEAGFSIRDGFELIGEIVETTALPVFIMSYGNLLYRMGVERFVNESRTAGATGLIVPDLPPGSDEGLYAAGRAAGVDIVPVVAPSVSAERLKRIGAERPRYLYAALRLGITGSYTEIGEENLRFLERLHGIEARVIAGFGIRSPEQVRVLAPHVHALVVGSAFVETILESADTNSMSELNEKLTLQVRSLVAGGVQ